MVTSKKPDEATPLTCKSSDNLRPSIDNDLILNALLGNVMRNEGAPSGVRNEIVDDAAGVLDALLSLGKISLFLRRAVLNHNHQATRHRHWPAFP